MFQEARLFQLRLVVFLLPLHNFVLVAPLIWSTHVLWLEDGVKTFKMVWKVGAENSYMAGKSIALRHCWFSQFQICIWYNISANWCITFFLEAYPTISLRKPPTKTPQHSASFQFSQGTHTDHTQYWLRYNNVSRINRGRRTSSESLWMGS